MQNPTPIFGLIGQILFPFSALLCEELHGLRIMVTAVVPPDTNLDSSLLSGQSFFNFHGGQMVGDDSDLEPVSVMTFFHSTTGVQLTLLMTYAADYNDPARFSIALQLPVLAERRDLDHGVENVLSNKKFETILLERQPSFGPLPTSDEYQIILEQYRTALLGRTVKLYLRQMKVVEFPGNRSVQPVLN